MNHTAEMLIADRIITQKQAEDAVSALHTHKGTIGQHLVEAGVISAEHLARHLATRYGMAVHRFEKLAPVSPDLASCIPLEMAWRLRVFPVSRSGTNLVLGIADPGNGRAVNEVLQHTRLSIIPILFSESDMTLALNRFYSRETIRSQKENAPAGRTSRAPSSLWEVASPDDDSIRHTISYGISIEDAINAIPLYMDENGEELPTPPPSEAPAPKSATPEAPKAPTDVEPIALTAVKLAPPTARPISPGGTIPRMAALTLPTTLPEPKTGSAEPNDADVDAAFDSWGAGAPPEKTKYNSWEPAPDVSAGKRSSVPADDDDDIPLPLPRETRSDAELLSAIAAAGNRGAIVEPALASLSKYAGRAIFLGIHKSMIRGIDIQGDYTSPTAIRSFWIPFSENSTLGRTATEGRIHLGPLGNSPSDAVFKAALGGRTGQTLIIPVAVRHRTIALLYADHISLESVPWPKVTRLAEVVAEAFVRILVQNRQA